MNDLNLMAPKKGRASLAADKVVSTRNVSSVEKTRKDGQEKQPSMIEMEDFIEI